MRLKNNPLDVVIKSRFKEIIGTQTYYGEYGTQITLAAPVVHTPTPN